jgi:prevent-host-death family protein
MTRRISTAEAEQNFASIIHDVEEGKTVLITNNGKDVARVSPLEEFDVNSESAKKARAELFERLGKTKAIDIGPWTRAELYEDEE